MTHQCFLTNRGLYLLVWNVKDGLPGIESLNIWLQNLQVRTCVGYMYMYMYMYVYICIKACVICTCVCVSMYMIYGIELCIYHVFSMHLIRSVVHEEESFFISYACTRGKVIVFVCMSSVCCLCSYNSDHMQCVRGVLCSREL